MFLNYKQIISGKYIIDAHKDHYRTASYDLRVDKIITPNGEVISKEGNAEGKYKIKPNSIIVAVSMERIELPYDIIGHAHVRTTLSQKGLMANNIGIIDPGYKGPISSVIVNYGKGDFEIVTGTTFLRINLSKIDKPTPELSLNYAPAKDAYVEDRKRDMLAYFGEAFINVDKIAEETKKVITNSYIKILRDVSFIFLALSIVLATFVFGAPQCSSPKEKLEDLTKQVNTFIETQNDFNDLILTTERKKDSLDMYLKEAKTAAEKEKEKESKPVVTKKTTPQTGKKKQ